MPTQPTGPPQAHRRLSLGVQAVAEARRFTHRTLAGWDSGPELVATAELVVSELVTNAVLYGYGAATLRLRREDELVVEVADRSSALPMPRVTHDDSEVGRGMHIIAACSSDWGVLPAASGGGKVVWCRVPWAGVRDLPTTNGEVLR